ncbi:DUF4435 domain-containing protein [Avibacterium sp. 20-15]|uniref:DUF4435 domain-containing protein n=1 Tax=unclassified Avibacterium TaxID=2685287 RepID=UPI0020265D5A|nr:MULTISPECIES: DUF4435 domain-containing protein [unclassified Avibacterium]MCW9732615.1 DUF4435 domain-containing protein [Avibacterium sp. 20-15]URL04766.1 DUF4435 domain-containing protein [Avibacterium sp. 20-132]
MIEINMSSNLVKPIPTPQEIYATAVMSKIPILIVEGIDDVPIYSLIVKKSELDFDIDIKTTSNILITRDDKKIVGCEGVIEFFKIIEKELIIQQETDMTIIKKYLLGIIDNDNRGLTSKFSENEFIFMLDRYSIENYLVNQETFRECLGIYLKCGELSLNTPWVDEEFHTLTEKLVDKLFFLCIEYLKKQKDRNYRNIIDCMKDDPSHYLENASKMQILKQKQDSLLSYAHALGLNQDFDTLIHICRGKWLLNVYSQLIQKLINDDNVHEKCRKGLIEQCDSCKVGNITECFYKKEINKANFGEILNKLKKSQYIEIPKNLISRLKEFKV